MCGNEIAFDLMVPWMSLAWLLVGIWLGMRLAAQRAARKASGGAAPARGGAPGDVELYVGNVASETDEAALRKAFEAHGAVSSVRVLTGRGEGRSKRFAFVMMRDRGEAEQAIKAMNGRSLDARELVVNEARSRRRRGGR